MVRGLWLMAMACGKGTLLAASRSARGVCPAGGALFNLLALELAATGGAGGDGPGRRESRGDGGGCALVLMLAGMSELAYSIGSDDPRIVCARDTRLAGGVLPGDGVRWDVRGDGGRLPAASDGIAADLAVVLPTTNLTVAVTDTSDHHEVERVPTAETIDGSEVGDDEPAG
jgi:hypothetical protein